MNFLDRAIAAINPVAGARRMAARAALDAALMVYDGATRSHRGPGAWRPIGGTSANTEIAMSLSRLRDVCRDFGRNNPIAANIHRRIAGHVVGAGIVPAVQAGNKKHKATLQQLIEDHLETPAIDYDGRLNLYGLQHLAMRSVVESGEALIVRHRQDNARDLPVPLQVRLLEGDYLDHNKNGNAPGGNILFQGIEFTPKGKRVAYWLFDEHPGGGLGWKMPVSRRVAASEVIHLYRVDRPGQQRGIPWGAPGIMTMWDLASYEEAELMRQKIAACFCIFFTGADSGSLAAGATKSAAGNPVATLEPGLIQGLPNGSTVTTATPPTSNGYRDVTLNAARKIAVAYGVPYEVATGDLSGVSFISGRLGRIDFNIDIDTWRWHLMIPHMCAGVGAWFIEAITMARGALNNPRFKWTPPRREIVSPKDEFPAMQAAIRAGLTTRSESVRSLGYDPEAVEQEYAEEQKRADALGLKFDSDPRKALSAPAPAARPDDGAEEGAGNDTIPPNGGDKGQE